MLGETPEMGDNSGNGSTQRANATPTLTNPAYTERDVAESDSSTPAGRAPAFQFYPKDFLADENVRVMSLQERGAYITLLCLCWSEGSLPSDIARLARLCGVPLAAFRRLWPALEPCFRASDPGRLVNPRLERERESQANYRRRQTDAANKRWQSRGNATASERHIPNDATAMPPQCSSSASAIFNLHTASPDSSQKNVPAALVPADARSKRPIFKGTRFVVFEWMLDDLRKLLGPYFEDFDLHGWFFALSERADKDGTIIPQRDGGKWLYEQTLAEAQRRGLPVSGAAPPISRRTAALAASDAQFLRGGGR